MAKKKKNKKIGFPDADKCNESFSAPSDEYAYAQRKADEALAALDDNERAEVIAAPDATVLPSPDFTQTDFKNSLDEFCADNITVFDKAQQSVPKKSKQSSAANAVQITILALCALVAVFCIFLLVKNIQGKLTGSSIYSDAEFDRFLINGENSSFNHPSDLSLLYADDRMLTLFERIELGKSPDNKPNSEYAAKLDAMKASLTALKAKNKDVYGWIYVENTTIDHPIMRGEDNEYYLDHAYTGEALPIGSLFFDFGTADYLPDNYNAVLYGHNVVAVAGSKSSMLHDITKFLDADFFNSNKIYIYTMDGVFIYKAVSVYPTTADYYYYRCVFLSEDSFLSFANEVIKNSKVPCDETFSRGDRMITFSTCTNGSNDGRYAMHAKLIEVIQ